MAEVSREVIVMVESEKFQRKIPNLEIPWSRVDTLVTDDGLAPSFKKQLKENGVNLICASINKG